MKGKIYKNRLSSTNLDDQQLANESIMINQLYRRSPSPKSSFAPVNQYQHQQSFTKNLTQKANENFHRSPDRTIINNLFQGTNYGKMQQSRQDINKLQNKPSYIEQLQGLTEKSRPASQANRRMLKKVLSNPDLISGQENNQILDNSFLNNTTNSRSILSPNKMNTRIPLRGNNSFGPSDNLKNMNKKTVQFDQQFSSMNKFDTKPYGGQISPQFSTNFYNPFPQGSNLYFQNDQNSRMRAPLTSDYIVSYEKRHKQRISALQSQHQLQTKFLQQEIKSRDDLIEQMKRMLRQKEEIIRKLQSQNASLSSRSYASFANYNNGIRQ